MYGEFFSSLFCEFAYDSIDTPSLVDLADKHTVFLLSLFYLEFIFAFSSHVGAPGSSRQCWYDETWKLKPKRGPGRCNIDHVPCVFCAQRNELR
jgi:hypothetical protein